MTFLVLGINHQTASVELREKVAFNPERIVQTLSVLNHHILPEDLVIVSTCNRTELYAIASDTDSLLNWLAQSSGLAVQELLKHVYLYVDAQALTHLMRVCSGLDSLMLGEPQILGQVKFALQLSRQQGFASSELASLFDLAFYAAKRVRTETSVGAHAISMGYAVAQLSKQVFSQLSDVTVLLVAAGEMNGLVAQYLAQQHVKKIIICNRGVERAKLLQQRLSPLTNTEIISFNQLEQALVQADVVSSCTGSLDTVIRYGAVKQALKKRRYAQMLLIDLAVPRDIDSAVAELDGAFLYGIDDLQLVIDDNLAQRQQAAVEAEILINQLATALMLKHRENQAGQLIQQYRQHNEVYKQQELSKALHDIKQGKMTEQVLEALVHRLSQKIQHSPSLLLRKAAQEEDPSMLNWLIEHLNLSQPTED